MHGMTLCCWILNTIMVTEFEISLWPKTARCQVGTEPFLAIMIFQITRKYIYEAFTQLNSTYGRSCLSVKCH